MVPRLEFLHFALGKRGVGTSPLNGGGPREVLSGADGVLPSRPERRGFAAPRKESSAQRFACAGKPHIIKSVNIKYS
jgi:hypothetical protein